MNLTLTIFGQMLTFGVLVAFVWKYLWGPMTQMLEERTKRIEDGLSAAERGKHELELAEKKAAETIREAKQKASEVIASANKQADEMIEEARGKARTEGQRQLEAAQAEIAQEKSRAQEHLREHVVAMAITMAEKVLAKEVDATAHNEFLTQMAKEL